MTESDRPFATPPVRASAPGSPRRRPARVGHDLRPMAWPARRAAREFLQHEIPEGDHARNLAYDDDEGMSGMMPMEAPSALAQTVSPNSPAPR